MSGFATRYRVAAAANPAPVAETPAPAKAPLQAPLRVGIDYYVGARTAGTPHPLYTDGFWAGSGPTYPSVVYLSYDDKKGSAARLSFGVGDLYTGGGASVHQPVEAWVQKPVGNLSLTAGKFWVPFGLQEWEYETKAGVMLLWTPGSTSLTAAATYNEETGSMNGYARAGQSFGPNLAIGLSAAVGKGLSYGSAYDRAVALDATISNQSWQLLLEACFLRDGSGDRFNFCDGKLTYLRLGKWKPSVGRYAWKDTTDGLGQFRSAVYSVDYQLNPGLTLEGALVNAYDHGAGKNLAYLQAHWTVER